MANNNENEEAMMMDDDVDISFDISEKSLDFLTITDEQDDFLAYSSTFLDDITYDIGDEVTNLAQSDENKQEVDTLSRSADQVNDQEGSPSCTQHGAPLFCTYLGCWDASMS